MSQLSEFWKHKGDVFSEAIYFLEHYAGSISGDQKAKLVLELMKALHISQGGIWGAIFRQAVLQAIDYELGRIRREPSTPPTPPTTAPPPASIYDVWTDGVLPDDLTLIARGFASGDTKWSTPDASKWLVSRPGNLVMNSDFEGLIG